MKQISINIRRLVKHKDFSSVFSVITHLKKKGPLKRKIVDFAI